MCAGVIVWRVISVVRNRVTLRWWQSAVVVVVVSLLVMMCQLVLACTNTTHSRTPPSCPSPDPPRPSHRRPYMQIRVASDNSQCVRGSCRKPQPTPGGEHTQRCQKNIKSGRGVTPCLVLWRRRPLKTDTRTCHTLLVSSLASNVTCLRGRRCEFLIRYLRTSLMCWCLVQEGSTGSVNSVVVPA